MATTIKIKNSATPSSTPSSLVQGEMALNVTDGRLFYGSGSGNDVKEFTGTTIDTGSFATTGSNIFIGNQTVTGSLYTTGSNTLIGTTTLTGSLNTSGTVNFAGTVIISGANPGLPPEALQVYGDIRTYGYHRFDPVTTNIDTSLSASYIYVSGSTNDLYFTQNGAGYNNTTRLRWLEGNVHTGILNGGIVSSSVGATTFNVSAGEGIITTLNTFTSSFQGPYPIFNHVIWSDFTGITPTYLNTHDSTWLLIDSDGNLIQQTNAPTNGQYDTDIQIGVLIHPNKTTISSFKSFNIPSYALGQQTFEFIRTFGGIKVSGHAINPSGSTLYVNRDEGVAFALGRNYAVNPNKPSYIEDPAREKPNLFKYYKSGSVFVTSTGVNTIDPNFYNTPSTSTGLSTVPGGQYTIKRFFYFPTSPQTLGVYYGRQTYNSISTALANLPYETFEENDNTLNQAIFCGYLIVKGGTTDLSNTSDAKFIQAGTFRNTLSGGGGATTSNLNSLSDVTIGTLSNKQLLVYDTGTSQWVNTKTGLALTGSLQGTATTASYVAANNIDQPFTHITASGNISGSGTGSFAYLDLPGFDFDSNAPSTALEVQGPITASAITSSGQIYGQVGVNEYNTSNLPASNTYSGDVIKLLSVSVSLQRVHYLNNTTWALAQSIAESTSDNMLAIAIGTNSNQGMLLRGLYRFTYNPGGNPGDPLYLSLTGGTVTSTAPSGTGEVVRIIGYKVDTNTIYFNPSNDYIVLA